MLWVLVLGGQRSDDFHDRRTKPVRGIDLVPSRGLKGSGLAVHRLIVHRLKLAHVRGHKVYGDVVMCRLSLNFRKRRLSLGMCWSSAQHTASVALLHVVSKGICIGTVRSINIVLLIRHMED